MADNIGYTPGTGATVAADDIGGVLHQRVKIGVGADGTATDVSQSNPMPTQETGELVEAIEALRMAVQSLAKTIGVVLPDTTGRLRVNVETGANVAITSLPTLSNVTTVATVTTLSNQTQIGSVTALQQVTDIMRISGDGLRRNISVS